MTLISSAKSLFPGPMLWLSSRRNFWREFWLSGEWEVRELSKVVDRKRGAVDVGGNYGTYAYHLSRLAKWVKVFEPNPDYASRLARLKLPNVTIEQAALSASEGEAELRIPRRESGREDHGMASLESGAVSDAQLARVLPVRLRTLDSYGLENVGFIKIDVEGHEEGVLDGAARTIAANRPVLLIEIEERHNAGGLARIAARLGAIGYDGFYFEHGSRKPLEGFRAERDQLVSAALEAPGHHRRSMAYINNFLFLPKAA